MDNITAIIKLAETLNCHIKLNEPMRNHTTFKIGGNAQVFLNIDNINQLKAVISECQKLNVPYLVLGKGSNLLINDNGIEGVVINLDGDFKNIDVLDDHTLYCGSGVSLAKLCSKALSCNLSGLEFAWGIPGSVGGAAYMNAGAYKSDMGYVVESVNFRTTFYKDFAVGLVSGSNNLVTEDNSASVMSGLTSLANNVDLSNIAGILGNAKTSSSGEASELTSSLTSILGLLK